LFEKNRKMTGVDSRIRQGTYMW